jgi:spermidine/putrescine-binding protein
MGHLSGPLSRRRFLQAAAGAAAAATAGNTLMTSLVRAQSAGPTGTFNWMTWSDHSYPEQLDAITAAIGITPNITLFSDNADAFAKLKEVGGQLDMVSGDALWVPRYYQDGLIDAWDINSLEVSKQLYPLAREFDFWTTPEGYLGFPFGWSPVQIYYDPAHVTPTPDSWDVLLDPKYAGRVIVENQPVEVMAYMGKLTGAVDPYNMTDAEIATAKDALIKLKPNVLRLAEQNTDTIAALANGEVWLATGNLGTDERVLAANGPQLGVFTPKEGTIGWMDAEMIVAEGANKPLIMPFLEQSNQPEYIAQNFLLNGRPLFNEGAYKVLVNNGEQERADRYLFNKPETVLTMTLKGPGSSTQAAIAAFNEVFSA